MEKEQKEKVRLIRQIQRFKKPNFIYLLFNSLLIMLICIGCSDYEKESVKMEKKVQCEIPFLSIKHKFNEQNFVDSTGFFKLVNKIINNSEYKKIEYKDYGILSSEVLKMISVSDTILSVDRKMDLIVLLTFYHLHATNAFRSELLKKNEEENFLTKDNAIFLLPVTNGYADKQNMKNILIAFDTIIVPEGYSNYTQKTLSELFEYNSTKKQEINNDYYSELNTTLDAELRKIVFSNYFFRRYKGLLKF